MANKLFLISIVLALLLIVAESTTYNDATWGMTRLSSDNSDLPATRSCNGLVGDCIGDMEEMLDSESNRRQLAGRRRRISYEAMKRDRVPCNRPGQSYYYCRGNVQANPYRRGCTYITHCARDMSS
ncbi:hypothetical protein vseg_007551 [Gypsophila vaccaria]